MTAIDDLRSRVEALEEKTDAVIGVLNDLMELLYEPKFVSKLDKLAKKDIDNGKKEID